MTSMEDRKQNWHRLTVEETLKQLKSSESGLSSRDAAARLRRFGSNRLFDVTEKKKTLLRRLLTDPALLLLFAVLVLAICFSELWTVIPAMALFTLWLFNAVWQLVRLQRSQDRMARSGIPSVTVLRNRKPLSVSARNVVVGDVVLLQKGDIVPADCRLITADSLQILFSWNSEEPGSHGAASVCSKNADTVYPYQGDCNAPNFENLVYAGSEIVSGSATAVVFAVGGETFLGMLGKSLCTDGFEREFRQIGQFSPFFKIFGFLSLILLFPIGILGLIISPDAQSGMRVFLPICAWAASASAVLPYCYFQIALHHRVRQLFFKKENGQSALIQSSKAVDRLAGVTDLILLGRAAISDGRLHLGSAYVGDTIASVEDENVDAWQYLCEAFCLLEEARMRLPYVRTRVIHTEPYLEELIEKSDFDREALAVRISKTELFRGRQEQILDVEGTNGQFRLRFYHTQAALLGCERYMRADGSMGVFDRERREAYEAFVRQSRITGQRTVTVVREQGGRVCLVGCLALREWLLGSLPKTLSQLEQRGIRVRLFLDENNQESIARANACFPRCPIRRRAQIEELGQIADEERVFVGYSDQQIASCIRAWKRQGRVVGVVTGDLAYRGAMKAASVAIGCDHCATEDTLRCSAVLQRDADLQVSGVTSKGGGLAMVKEAIFGLQQTERSLSRFFDRLFFLRILQAAFLIFSILTGMGGIPTYAVLYSSLLLDVFLLVQVTRDHAWSKRDDRGVSSPNEILRRGSAWISAVIPPFALLLILRIFLGMELLSLENCYGAAFLSLFAMEILMLTVGTPRLHLGLKTARDFLILLLPVLVLVVVSALVSQTITIIEMDLRNVIAVVVSVFCISLEALFLLLPSMKRR